MRIFDNPNHPQYGPVRRMWVVLAQLDVLEAAEPYKHGPNKKTWDQTLAVMIRNGARESDAQCELLRQLLDGWVLP